MARAKRLSDELYNARRRLRRQAARMERDADKQAGALKQQMLSYARALRKEAEAGKKLTEEERRQSIERLGRVREASIGAAYSRYSTYRRNLIVQQQINAAGTMGADSTITEQQKNVFWIAVKGLWPEGSNVPRDERYQKVLEHFYSGIGQADSQQSNDQRAFYAWLRARGIQPEAVYNDLSLVFEYVTQELNDSALYSMPEVRYEVYADRVITLR